MVEGHNRHGLDIAAVSAVACVVRNDLFMIMGERARDLTRWRLDLIDARNSKDKEEIERLKEKIAISQKVVDKLSEVTSYLAMACDDEDMLR